MYICGIEFTNAPTDGSVPQPTPYVHVAEIGLNADVDPADVGAAVTLELCGAWQHQGACRWPHNNEIQGDGPFLLRVLFLAGEADEPAVRQRIETALRSSADWSVVSSSARPIEPIERALAARLSGAP